MLFPVCCFSCGACIGHLWNIYRAYIREYNNQIRSNKFTFLGNDKDANQKFNERINNTKLGTPSAEELALITLNVNRMCCRRMFLTHIDTYNIMNLVK